MNRIGIIGAMDEEVDILVELMDIKETILNVMKEAGKPISAGEVEKLSGLDRKDIDKAFKELKKEEAIVSPVRCKWEPAK